MLSDKDRHRIRKLQDEIIRLAVGRGYDDASRVGTDAPQAMTIGNLRRYLYDRFEPDLIRIRDLLAR